MKSNRVLRGIRFALFAIVFAAVISLIVMSLWNWLMPALFGLHTISYWQAVGLLILSKILFGGFRGRFGGSGHWRRRMMERWAQMTPEEREKFREGMRARCGHRAQAPASDPPGA